MVNVTDEAKVMLHDLLDKALEDVQTPSKLPERNQMGLRLIARDGGLGLGIDSTRGQDRVIEHEGNPVLLIDPEVDRALGEATIGTTETPEGKHLTISR